MDETQPHDLLTERFWANDFSLCLSVHVCKIAISPRVVVMIKWDDALKALSTAPGRY